jgi:hypothetical protein
MKEDEVKVKRAEVNSIASKYEEHMSGGTNQNMCVIIVTGVWDTGRSVAWMRVKMQLRAAR